MQNRYPKISIRSKNELAKHISSGNVSRLDALELINDVLNHFNEYWKDNVHESEPKKEKYVRSAWGTPLGRLLKCINSRVLAPHDVLVPGFIFGGIGGANHISAVNYLRGNKHKRSLLKIDISRFFEQISDERVYSFFHQKCGCGESGAKLLAQLATVPAGPKGSNTMRRTIARGFATSSRLALWCNLDTFMKVYWVVCRELRGKDPRIAVYVDDIGITASGVSKDKLERLRDKIYNILESHDANQSLPVNRAKTKIRSHEEGLEHLGISIARKQLGIGAKTLSKKMKLHYALTRTADVVERQKLLQRRRSIARYERYVRSKSYRSSHHGA